MSQMVGPYAQVGEDADSRSKLRYMVLRLLGIDLTHDPPTTNMLPKCMEIVSCHYWIDKKR